jgi:hypothetical protein
VIGSGTPVESGFGSTGRLQEVGINHIAFGKCDDLYDGDGDLDDSVVLCVVLCFSGTLDQVGRLSL